MPKVITTVAQARRTMKSVKYLANKALSGNTDAAKKVIKLSPRLLDFEKTNPGQVKILSKITFSKKNSVSKPFINISELCRVSQSRAIKALEKTGKLGNFMSGRLGKTFGSAHKALGLAKL